MKFRNKFWLILFREYISPKLFAVWFSSHWSTEKLVNKKSAAPVLRGSKAELHEDCTQT